jgi:imidazolonepropionase-like amidohydrolase
MLMTARAGVLLALTTDHNSVPIQFLALQAVLAVKEGLDPAAALRAITINPAPVLGLDDRVGALKPERARPALRAGRG